MQFTAFRHLLRVPKKNWIPLTITAQIILTVASLLLLSVSSGLGGGGMGELLGAVISGDELNERRKSVVGSWNWPSNSRHWSVQISTWKEFEKQVRLDLNSRIWWITNCAWTDEQLCRLFSHRFRETKSLLQQRRVAQTFLLLFSRCSRNAMYRAFSDLSNSLKARPHPNVFVFAGGLWQFPFCIDYTWFCFRVANAAGK